MENENANCPTQESTVGNSCEESNLECKGEVNQLESSELFNGVEISKLTKSQLKKYHKMLRWQGSKKEKRKKERLRTKNKRIEAKVNHLDLGPSRKQLKRCTMATSPCKTGVAIDLSFDHLMTNKVSTK